MAYYSTTYWGTNYSAPRYWSLTTTTTTPTTAEEYWGGRFWSANYWGANYWALSVTQPGDDDVSDVPTDELVRMLVFGMDPDYGLNSTYSWNIAPDGNTAGKAFTCAYIPRSKSSKINLLQETMFLGGVNLGRLYQTFKQGLSQDEGESYRAEWLTQMIDPTLAKGQPPDTKRFVKIEFPHINTLEQGITVEISCEAVEPHKNPAIFKPLDWTSPNSIAGIPSGVAKWINIRGIDDTNISGIGIFDGFILHFYPLSDTQGDDN